MRLPILICKNQKSGTKKNLDILVSSQSQVKLQKKFFSKDIRDLEGIELYITGPILET